MGRRIAVFCSASFTVDPKFNSVTAEFARKAVAAGHVIVSGGTVKGTMGVLSDTLAACGGTHIGVIPGFMEQYVHPSMSEVIWTDTMALRKEKMRELADVVVALPGGIGTLDEFIETLTLKKLKRFDGEMYALDTDGFYGPFKALLEHYVATDMLEREVFDMVKFPATPDELLKMLED